MNTAAALLLPVAIGVVMVAVVRLLDRVFPDPDLRECDSVNCHSIATRVVTRHTGTTSIRCARCADYFEQETH